MSDESTVTLRGRFVDDISPGVKKVTDELPKMGAAAHSATAPWQKEMDSLNASLQDNIFRLKAQKDLLSDPVYQQSVKQAASLREEVNSLTKGLTEQTDHTHKLNEAEGLTVRQRRELIVMMHEASQGRFKNLAGSAMVLEEGQGGIAGAMSNLAGVMGGPVVLAATAAAAAIGVATVALYEMGAKAAEDWHRMSLLAETLGTTTETIQAFEHATIGTGVTSKQVASALEMFTVKLTDHRIELQKLGIASRDPIKAFEQLMDLAKSIHDPIERNKIMSEALGRSWKELAPFLMQGSRALEEAKKAMKPDPEAVERMERMVALEKEASKEWDVIKVHAGQSATVIKSSVLEIVAGFMHASTAMKIAALTGSPLAIGKIWADERKRLDADAAKEREEIAKNSGKTQRQIEYENHVKLLTEENQNYERRKAQLVKAGAHTELLEKQHLARLKEIREAFYGPDKKTRKGDSSKSDNLAFFEHAAHELRMQDLDERMKKEKDAQAVEDVWAGIIRKNNEDELKDAQKNAVAMAALRKMVDDEEIAAMEDGLEKKEAIAEREHEANLARLKDAYKDTIVYDQMILREQSRFYNQLATLRRNDDAEKAKDRKKEFDEYSKNLSGMLGIHNSTLTTMIRGKSSFAEASRKIEDDTKNYAITKGLEYLESWMAQQITAMVFSDGMKTAEAAKAEALGAAETAAYATPAALASVASWGTAAEVGGAALAGVLATYAAMRETGGSTFGGSGMIVGEKRPEYFQPTTPGQIHNSVTNSYGGDVIHIHTGLSVEAVEKVLNRSTRRVGSYRTKSSH